MCLVGAQSAIGHPCQIRWARSEVEIAGPNELGSSPCAISKRIVSLP